MSNGSYTGQTGLVSAFLAEVGTIRTELTVPLKGLNIP